MLNFLFRRLTAEPAGGIALFDALTAEARQLHWYVEGQLPDTLDGRFAVLAPVNALALARLEQLGEAGNAASVALTERFITVMESEHRELGLGDPALGKKVRKLVGSLAKRAELWRGTVEHQAGWVEATQRSMYKDAVSADALNHSSESLKALWVRLERTDLDSLVHGRIN